MRVFVILLCLLGGVGASPTVASFPGVDTHERIVEVNDGSRLQSTITLPAGGAVPRHPLLFTQWVSCGSLDYREGSNAHELLAALARDSGLALVLVKRSALDDSGPACGELDYDTEVAHYVEAFTELLGDKRIDASRVYIYGSSLGSTTAPLVALELQEDGFDIGGVMVQGGGAATYLERMLNFERIYLERRPDDVDPADIHGAFLDRARFQFEYLVARRHPDEIADDSPAMARIRGDILGMEENNQYGRPFAWHQQAAQRNFLAAWGRIDAPVLVIFNEFDQFEMRHGHRLIAEMVDRLRPGTATFIERPNVGHNHNRYPSIIDAYAFRDGAPAWHGTAEIMLNWLAEVK